LLHGIHKEDLNGQVAEVNWIVGALIDDLRSGRTRDISTAMTGLVSMPSFHAAAAVILGWVSLYLGWLRIPLVLLNIAMLLSTIISGSHYFIDVIAGSVLAGMAIWTASRLVDWQHSLQQPPPSPAA
jgi:membrane-associated phospholipid phosphatase